jgi:phosphoglycolate phosphatase-like HAD superfamily hydrolase
MLLFWDIDGTLLTTGRAGIYAWEDALHEVAGVRVDLSEFDTAGHPDFLIARRLLVQLADRADPPPAMAERLVRRYEELLPAALTRRQGRVFPNVREILESLAREAGTCSLLLTGNTRRGARAKLVHYGLAEFFSDGAFSEGDGDRTTIACAALEQASASGCVAQPGRVFVVGDTPYDVRCARAIGARAVAVATGSYAVSTLAAEGAWRVLSQLPSAAEFRQLLDGRAAAANA